MANGIINLDSTSSKLEGRIVWESSSNGSSANSSYVAGHLQVRRNDGYTTTGTWTGALNVANIKVEQFSKSCGVGSAWVTMLEFAVTKGHNDDGTANSYFEGYCHGPTGTSMAGQNISGNQTVTLDTIPRKSRVLCADGNIGSSTTININRASSKFTHTLKYSFGSSNGTIAIKTNNTSIGWTIPTSFYTQIPNAKSGQGTITCETYDSNTLIGSSTCSFNAIVLESTNKPSISASVEDTNTTTIALTGDKNKLVKYFSNAKVVITATAKNSATIKSQKVVCGDGKSATTATSTLNKVESGSFVVSTSDSRGYSNSETINKTLVNYIKLAITELSIIRESSTSNTIKASLKGNYFNSSFGSVANTLALKWRYRIAGGTWSGYTTITATLSGNTFTYSGTLGTTFDYQKAYEFEIVAQDKLITDTKNKSVTVGIPLFDIWKDNFKVNGTNTATKFVGPLQGTAEIAKKSGYYWNAKTHGQAWSRICSIAPGANTIGLNGILTLGCTRGNVICNYTFLVNSSHLANAGLVQISATKYSTFRIRVLGSTTGACYIEIYDTANNIAAGTEQNWYCSFTPLMNCTVTPYTAFTSGGVPSGFSVSADITTNNTNKILSERGLYLPTKTLYNNTSGTTGSITLNESAANFSFLEIFFGDISHILSTKVFNPNGKKTNLAFSYWVNNLANTQFIEYSISNTNMTRATDGYYFNSSGQGTANDIKVFNVMGYR